jgi:hypothetical protein
MTATTNLAVDPTMESHRSSPLPTWSMIMTRFMELRKRRGLMIAILTVNIGVPSIFLIVRLIAHAVAPHSYGPAGGSSIFEALIGGLMYLFGFIVAATLGCTAGSVDLTDGMFRHLVVTGRSRLALYFARIPAGLMIIVPVVAAGVIIVSTVCVAASPNKLNFDGINNVPVGLSRQGFVTWADQHSRVASCDLNFNFNGPPTGNVVQCGGPRGNNNPQVIKVQPGGGISSAPATKAEMVAQATKSANQDYHAYSLEFLKPSLKLIIKTGLWVELWAIIGFLVGLGLASLMGQRTVPVVLLIVYEIVLTPLFSRTPITHLIPAQRALVGLAMANIEPAGLPAIFGGQGNGGGGGGAIPHLLTESTLLAWIVIGSWIVIWTGLGAWRMATRDA